MSEVAKVPESAVREELEMVSRILDGLTEAIVIAGQKEGSLFFNSAAERLFGIPRNKFRPDDWLTLGGCYLTDETTPYPAERSPILRSLKGETIVGEQVFVKNP